MKIRHFVIFPINKKSQALWSRELLGKNFPEKIAIFFEETSYEIDKILGGFGQFF